MTISKVLFLEAIASFLGFSQFVEEPKNYVEAREKVEIIIENSEDEVYAGRTDRAPLSKYDWNGTPIGNRKWLSQTEWKGKHISKSKLSKEEKSLMLNRFKKWKKKEIEDFITYLSKAAVEESNLHGNKFPASLVIAQAILESNYGKSKLYNLANNVFGHKYRGKNKKDRARFMIAADDSPTDKFSLFRSKWFSIRAHSKLLLSKRYKSRVKGKPTLDKWLNALCGGMTSKESLKFVVGSGKAEVRKSWKGGSVYATSCFKRALLNKEGKCYGEKLRAIINMYDLEKFD